MSDTVMEKSSNSTFCKNANGRVLIGGLGIGLIIYNILPKLETGEITEIVVIESEKDVIDLVAPYYKHNCINIIHADMLTWKPVKGEKFDTIYFDIWEDINLDNLEEIRYLHNSFKTKLNRSNPKCWMNSWMKERLQSEKRRSNSYF